jgi:hypothetical protein
MYRGGSGGAFPLRATSSKRASEASTSPSGELCDEVGGTMRAMREQLLNRGSTGSRRGR